MHILARQFSLLLGVIAVTPPALAEIDVRGNLTQELTVFSQAPLHRATQRSNLSVSAETEFYSAIGENGSLTVTPFLRVDGHDSERSHADFREFIYSHLGDGWELRAGLGKVFFGVAESENVVDFINQSDTVESFTTDQKLGQPMLNLLLIRDWGNIDLYVLPGFRERTFPGPDGRPRLPIDIDTSATVFEASNAEHQVDVAARISTVIGDWDLGAHVFHGTNREPILQFEPRTNTLAPFYFQNTEIGFDAQATLESWLLKAEVVHRFGQSVDDQTALVTGFEYSFFDIANSGADVGIVAEFLFEERGENNLALLQNDALLALRFALNDAASTEALFGVVTDLDGEGNLFSLEASRRLGSNIKASITYTGFSSNDADSDIRLLDREDNTRLELGYFF